MAIFMDGCDYELAAGMSHPEPTGPLPLGSVLDGAYRLTSLVSQGGMGTVYEAVQLRLDRRVAVKVMAVELAENKEALARFRREVRITAKLAHPHIVQLLDFGTTENGQPYLVTEFLEGEDLEQRLHRFERLPLPFTLDIARQVVAALVAIHGKGVVHRDLKPANVFLVPIQGGADVVKLVDFGISKLHAASTQLTHAPSMLGTPEYMSPEQASARSDAVDHRTDQWALACMLWRMLTGAPPFGGRDLNALLNSIVHDEPPSLLELAPRLTPDIEAVLRRGLSKRQSARYPTVLAFWRAFENVAKRAKAADVAADG
jgi:eukaryotic-like serine/threonine-protein kinase